MKETQNTLIIDNSEEELQKMFDFTINEYNKYLDTLSLNSFQRKSIESALFLSFQRYAVEMVKADTLLNELIAVEGEEKVQQLLDDENGFYQKALSIAIERGDEMIDDFIASQVKNATGAMVS